MKPRLCKHGNHHVPETDFVESRSICCRCILVNRRRLDSESYIYLGRTMQRRNSSIQFSISDGKAVVRKTISHRGRHELHMHTAALQCCSNIVPLISADVAGDSIVLTTPYIDTLSFKQICGRRNSKRFLRALLQSLRDLHRAGIIHGDLKPDNILMAASNRSVFVCDFGLACL